MSNARKEKCSTDAGVMKTMLVNSVHVQVVVDKVESSEACERSEGGSAKDQRWRQREEITARSTKK